MAETDRVAEQHVDPESQRRIATARRHSPFDPASPPTSPTFPSLGALLAARTAAAPDKNWITYYNETGRAGAYSYSEFEAITALMAAWLHQRLGLQRGDRLATLMVNDPRTVLTYFAAWRLGVTVVPVNPNEDIERIHYILHHSEVRIVLIPAENNDRWSDLPTGLAAFSPADRPSISVLGLPAALCTADAQAAAGFFACEPQESLPQLSSDNEALIVYTSGTTGPPKGVVLEHANLLADAESISRWMEFDASDRAMNVLPLHHVNGTVVTLVTPLSAGGSVVLNRKFHAQTFWQTLADERCTWVSVVPTILAFLNERHDDLTRYDLSAFRRILCGAGPLTVELAVRFYNAFGLRITHGYGLSETTCYSCFLPPHLTETEYRYWMHECGFPSIGCPLPVNEMQIHDAQGNAMPPDTRGEIVIRGENVMRYYFQRPDANRDTFAHGWFRSGDEGFYRTDSAGRPFYFITGRIKEIIIRGGINLSPFDIDEVLNAIPGIRAAMAVGFENNFYGEEVGAYVQLEPGQDLEEATILQACRASLPYTKSPKVVVFGDTFPVTSTGKYQRNKLRPLFAAWKDTQFREPK